MTSTTVTLTHPDILRSVRTTRMTVARDRVALVKATDAALIAAAREWLADCYWGDLDPEDFDALTDAAIARGVRRFYDGGWAGFVGDYLASDVITTSEPTDCTGTDHEHCPLHGCVEYVCCQRSTTSTRYALTYTRPTSGRRITVTISGDEPTLTEEKNAIAAALTAGTITDVRLVALPAVPTVNLRKQSVRQRILDGQAHARRYARQAAQLTAFGGDALDLRDVMTVLDGYSLLRFTSPLMRVQV